jgi:hypothetical protein
VVVVELNAVLNKPQYASELQLHFPVVSSGILLSGASSLNYGQDDRELGIQFPTTAEIILLSTLSSGVHPNFYPPCVGNSFPSKQILNNIPGIPKF